MFSSAAEKSAGRNLRGSELRENNESEPKAPEQHKESSKLSRLKTVKRLSTYGFWFTAGVAIANVSRAIPNAWILYWLFHWGVAAYLLFIQPEKATTEVIANRRMAGLSLFLSSFAFWDAGIAIATTPIFLGLWILPIYAWLVIGVVGFFLVIFLAALIF